MPRTFAIGDIHGCRNTFNKLLAEEINIQKADVIYCMGDYIDRGKDSKGVIDSIINLRHEGYQIHTLRGNHEQMMLDSTIDKERSDLWIKNGGDKTLKSFNISSVKQLPENYLGFLNDTKFFIATNEYVFVHAGLNFLIRDPFKDEEAMLWSREKYFDKLKIGNRVLIHGHTPLPLKQLLKQKDPYKINIDGGCVYNDKPGYGNLMAISLPDMKMIPVKNID